MSDEVRRHIREVYGQRIASCYAIRDYALKLLASLPSASVDSQADALILAILTRSVDTFVCSVRASTEGYGTQGAMFNRSLFEDMIDAHWIATEPDLAVSRFEDHFEHGRMLLADAATKYPDIYPDLEARRSKTRSASGSESSSASTATGRGRDSVSTRGSRQLSTIGSRRLTGSGCGSTTTSGIGRTISGCTCLAPA